MDTVAFEDALRRDGFTEVETRRAEPDHFSPTHTHPCDVRALILSGQVTLDFGNEARTYRAGDTIVVDAGCPHSEQHGPDGYSYLVGRRHPR